MKPLDPLSNLVFKGFELLSKKYPITRVEHPIEKKPLLTEQPLTGPRPTNKLNRPRFADRSGTIPIDVSIVTFNSSKWLPLFLESLVKQSYPLNLINLLCCDNNSSDTTIQILQNFKKRFAAQFMDIAIHCSSDNLGYGGGHNRNLQKSRSEYFLVTNIDLEFEDITLNQVVFTAQSDDKNIASWEMRQKPHEHPKYYDPVTLETSWNSGACTLYRTTALELVNGFDEELFMYCEDVDLSYRLRDEGFLLKYEPKAVVWHYAYDENLTPKSLQVGGSILGNLLLRLRFGSPQDILEIPSLVSRWAKIEGPAGIDFGQVTIAQCGQLIRKGLHFLLTRKSSAQQFGFLDMNFEIHREGATFQYSKPDAPAVASRPLVSAIIRTHGDRLQYLEEALVTLANQTYPNMEVLVVEDGSDKRRGRVEEIASKTGMNLRHIAIQKKGRSIAGNIGLENARGEFAFFFDDDDLLWADHVEVLTETLIKNPNAPAAYTHSWEIQTQILSTSPLRYREVQYKQLPHMRDLFTVQRLIEGNFITIQSILFRRKLFERLGGLHPDLDALEDWNLWLRYSTQGQFVCAPKTTSLYRISSSREDFERRSAHHLQHFDTALNHYHEELRKLNASAMTFQ